MMTCREVPLKRDGLCDDNRGVYALRSKRADGREDERESTLPEPLTTIAILRSLIAIAVIRCLVLLEPWRANVVTKQLVGDLRRSRASATATQVTLRNRMR